MENDDTWSYKYINGLRDNFIDKLFLVSILQFYQPDQRDVTDEIKFLPNFQNLQRD
ncbi:hypothetical protein RhiirA5_432096 [Rhizophagus irregularis]|uniref:Uncharacterized protein n=1 Tax=Rhizophagus irregularis TaxID=588596 RepID=A0A2N0NTX6_9GLOM|nr:hypothetical protein RhiirA5_432096 [Rhizophagus irregularis]